MDIRLIPGYDRPELVQELFSEYAKLIISKDSRFEDYLAIQSFKEELSNLEGKYGGPGGRLYLAYWKDKLAGCVAMRQIDEHRCEMKRPTMRMASAQKTMLPAKRSGALKLWKWPSSLPAISGPMIWPIA